MTRIRARFLGVLVGVIALAAPLAGTATASAARTTQASAKRPNVVFVLTDDLSSNLVKYMPHVQALARRGMTFDNYTVTDSLCCPSRASILTGMFPHDTHVLGNTLADSGGYDKFVQVGDQHKTFAVGLSRSGVRTGFFGKYLNWFDPHAFHNPNGTLRSMPGWNTFNAVGQGGYSEFRYTMTRFGHLYTSTIATPQTYLTGVLWRDSAKFIRNAAAAHKPFMAEVATYAPHSPYIPAPKDRDKFPGLKVPRTPAYMHQPTNAPAWLRAAMADPAERTRTLWLSALLALVALLLARAVTSRFTSHSWWRPSTRQLLAGVAAALAAFGLGYLLNVGNLFGTTTGAMNQQFRMRVQDVQSVDRMVSGLENTLAATGQLSNTVFVFSSDNGYHIGEHGLYSGKDTAFDTDIRVPLIVAGPGIPHGVINHSVVEATDLAPTFDQLSGVPIPAWTDGHSLVPLLHGKHPKWRTVALIEHTRPRSRSGDPDAQTMINGEPPSYDAIRTATFTYVQYQDGEHEFYNRAADPFELHNVYRTLSGARKQQLAHRVASLTSCHGLNACWSAALPRLHAHS